MQFLILNAYMHSLNKRYAYVRFLRANLSDLGWIDKNAIVRTDDGAQTECLKDMSQGSGLVEAC